MHAYAAFLHGDVHVHPLFLYTLPSHPPSTDGLFLCMERVSGLKRQVQSSANISDYEANLCSMFFDMPWASVSDDEAIGYSRVFVYVSGHLHSARDAKRAHNRNRKSRRESDDRCVRRCKRCRWGLTHRTATCSLLHSDL